MKMRVIALGDKEFTLDGEFAAPAIAGAIAGESGEDVRSEIIDYTDTERSGMDHDEYAIVTGDDGGVLWQGWLDSGKAGDPPPAGVPLPPVVSGPAQLEVSPGRAAYEASLIVIGEDLDGTPLPWASLPPGHREAWRAAADAAVMLAGITGDRQERDAAVPAREPDDALATLHRAEAERDTARAVVLEMATAIRADMHGNGRIARSEVTAWCERAGVEFDIHADEDDL